MSTVVSFYICLQRNDVSKALCKRAIITINFVGLAFKLSDVAFIMLINVVDILIIYEHDTFHAQLS